jgi:hypothetical protein
VNLKELETEVRAGDILIRLDGTYTVTKHMPGAFLEVEARPGAARQVLDYNRHPEYVTDWVTGVLRVFRQDRLF